MTYPNMPASILIDGIAYQVIVEDRPNEYEDGTDGEFNATYGTIRLRKGLAIGYARVTLLHESLHGLWEHRGFTAVGRPPPSEEEVVSGMSYGLYELLRNNPALVEFLRGTE